MSRETRSGGRFARLPLGRLTALLLGGAVVFFCLAAPADLLVRLMGEGGFSRLSALLSPPFGVGGRALIAFLVTVLTFLVVWVSGPEEEPDEPAAFDTPLAPEAPPHVMESGEPLRPARLPPPTLDDPIPILLTRLESGLIHPAASVRFPAFPNDRVD